MIPMVSQNDHELVPSTQLIMKFGTRSSSVAELTSILAADLVYDFLNVLAGGVDGRDIKEKTAVHEEL